MEDRLLELLKKSKKPLSLEKIFDKLDASEEEKEYLLETLNNLVDSYAVIKTSKDNYVPIEKTSFRKGRFISNKNGSGNVLVKYKFTNHDGESVVKNISYEVLDKDVNGAIDGDLVFVNLYSKQKNGVVYADIKNIINRKLDSLVGEVYKAGNNYYVKALDKRKKNVVVKLDNYEVEGIKVLVDLINQNEDGEYLGHVLKRFNHKFDPTEDILLEAFKCGLSDEFSKETLKELENIPDHVLDSEKIGRLDLTNEEIFTIDGADTKDIDDAVSCKILENGNYLVGVHIADVSHYVKSGSAIDNDAYSRGTSAYLANKVIPMLPRELSNGICSLNPNVERLAMSCIMEVDKNGNVVNHSINKSVIKSNLKMTYDEVNNILHDRDFNSEYLPHVKTLKNLNKLALILRKKRISNGALEFNRPEVKFIFDENDQVIGIKNRVEDLGESLIEEFMILANETVDKHLVSHGYNPLHRVHDVPVPEKVESFFKLLNIVGYSYDDHDYFECCDYPKYFQDLGRHVRETGRLSNALSMNLIRCMSKAKYSPDNIGHFGLVKDYYCHFTSPIRRYPDLINHRLLKLDLENIPDNIIKPSLEEYGMHTSKCERNANEAEIEVFKMKAADYLSKHIGEEYNGVVIDLDEAGLSIQLDNYIEGRVKINDLPGRYVYKEDLFSLESLDNFNSYTIGDYLKLKLKDTSKEKKTINFEVVDKLEDIKEKKITKNNK